MKVNMTPLVLVSNTTWHCRQSKVYFMHNELTYFNALKKKEINEFLCLTRLSLVNKNASYYICYIKLQQNVCQFPLIFANNRK